MPTLLADIGGTHARFALLPADAAVPEAPARLALDGFADIASALRDWLATRPGAEPRAAVLAVAGPVAGNRAVLTNRGWPVDGAELAAALGFASVTVVNDFVALAWGLPQLKPAELLHLGGPLAGKAAAPRSVIGPGTGLGVAAFIPPGTVLATEGGHAALAAGSAEEAAVIERLRARFGGPGGDSGGGSGGGHVSVERGALSGQGIEALYQALGGAPGLGCPRILEQGRDGGDPRCRAALDLHCALLGGFAGDVALLHGAEGGVHIAGGIAARLAWLLPGSAFRARFEAKGRMRPWLQAVPTWLIRDPEAAAMLGLAHLARQG